VPNVQLRVSGQQRKRARQRLVLSKLFNGDLQNSDHIDHWTTDLEPSRELILKAFVDFGVPALLPSKPPLFPRGKWTNSELRIDWFGLIDAHHCLLWPTVRVWLERMGVKVDDPLPTKILDNSTIGWGDFFHSGCLSDLGPDPVQPGPVPLEDIEAMGPQPDLTEGQQPATNEQQKDEWLEKRKQWRKRFLSWGRSVPGPSLVMIRRAISPSVQLTYDLLALVGDKWEKREQLKWVDEQERSYACLEAHRGTLLEPFWAGMEEEFHLLASDSALPSQAYTRRYQTLLFRMLSGIGTAMALHIQTRWQSYPIRLFGLIDGVDDSEAISECPDILDQLSTEFYQKYPTPESRNSNEAMAILITIARATTLGIAEIEARHASTRRIATVLATQTHVPNLVEVSASWTCRRNAAMRRSAELFPKTSQQEGDGNLDLKEKTEKTDGRRGGAWHAFMNERLLGKRLADVMPQLRKEWTELTSDQKAYYERVGKLASISSARGFQSFISPPASSLQMLQLQSREVQDPSSQQQLVPAVPCVVQDLHTSLRGAVQELNANFKRRDAEQSDRDKQLNLQLQEFREGACTSSLDNLFEAFEHHRVCSEVRQPEPCPIPSLHSAEVHLPADIVTQARFCCYRKLYSGNALFFFRKLFKGFLG